MIATRRRGLLSVVAMLAIVGVALQGPLQVAAQSDSTTGNFDFKGLEGYQRGAGRTYMGDLSTLFGNLDTATPGAEEGTPDLSQLGLFLLQGFVVQFDNSDHASAGFDNLTDQIAKGAGEDEELTFSEAQVDNIGDKTRAFSGQYAEEGIEGSAVILLTQKGDFIYAAVSVSFGSDQTGAVTTFVTDMSNKNPGDGDGTFKDDGTSTGGLWDVFPAADADYLKGLAPVTDQDLSQSEQ